MRERWPGANHVHYVLFKLEWPAKFCGAIGWSHDLNVLKILVCSHCKDDLWHWMICWVAQQMSQFCWDFWQHHSTCFSSMFLIEILASFVKHSNHFLAWNVSSDSCLLLLKAQCLFISDTIDDAIHLFSFQVCSVITSVFMAPIFNWIFTWEGWWGMFRLWRLWR